MAAEEPDRFADEVGGDAPESHAGFGVRLTWPGADDPHDRNDSLAPEAEAEADAGGEGKGKQGRPAGEGWEGLAGEASRDEPGGFEASPPPGPAAVGGSGVGPWSPPHRGTDSGMAGTSGADPSSAVGRVESLHQALNALAMRIEALVSGTSRMTSAIGERLNDQADTLHRLVRAQAADLEGQQRTTDRTLAELRRAVGDTADTIAALGGRFNELDRAAAELSRRLDTLADESRDLRTSNDKLSRQVIDRLDSMADRLVERLEGLDSSLTAEVGASRTETGRVRDSVAELGDALGSVRAQQAQLDEAAKGLLALQDAIELVPADEAAARPAGSDGEPLDLAAELAGLHDRLQEVAALAGRPVLPPIDLDPTNQALASLRAEVAELAEQAAHRVPAPVAPVDLEPIRAELASLRSDVAALADRETSTARSGDLDPVTAELAGMRSELGELRRSASRLQAEVAKVRDEAGTTDDRGDADATAGLDAVREELVALRGRLPLNAGREPSVLDGEQLDRLADVVVERLREVFEVVPDSDPADGG